MFYGVVEESYITEFDLKETLAKAKKVVEDCIKAIMKKAGELLEKAKKFKSDRVEDLKNLYDKCKELWNKVAKANEKEEIDKAKQEADNINDTLKKQEELMKDVLERQAKANNDADDALNKMNAKAQAASAAANKK